MTSDPILPRNEPLLNIRDYQRILIIKPSSLGDVIHALPVLAGLRAAHPDAHVSWLIGKGFDAILRGHPLIDELLVFDRKHYGRMWRSWRAAADFRAFCRDLRGRFDLVIDLQGLFRSGFLARVSGARARVGFASAREFAAIFYTHRLATPPDAAHAVDRNLAIARALALPVAPPEFPLAITSEERGRAAHRLAQAWPDNAATERYIALAPGARWESKRWPPERFARLLDELHAARYPPAVLVGAPSEKPTADQILAKASAPCVNLTGETTLRELAALLERADALLCLDSGPMHIAAALGTPTLAIFGPTDPRRTGPYSQTARTVTHPVPCQPCLKRICPLGHHDCLERLSVADVLAAVDRLPLGGGNPRAVQLAR